jgi:hypothetical protein
MRPLSRLIALGALSALVAAPSAMAANSATASLSPNKGGTITQGNPVKFKVKALLPDTPSDTSGNRRLLAIQAKLPVPLLFNTIPFSQCDTASFPTSKSCPSSTKLGTATILADGGPSVGEITAKTTLYYGTGFTVLANVTVDKPAIINEGVVGSLRSSGTAGYGLEMYIPVPQSLSMPLQDLYPTVKSVDADFAPPKKKVKVGKERITVPLAGLGPCPSSKKLNFQVNALYTDATGVTITKNDSASTTAKCKK